MRKIILGSILILSLFLYSCMDESENMNLLTTTNSSNIYDTNHFEIYGILHNQILDSMNNIYGEHDSTHLKTIVNSSLALDINTFSIKFERAKLTLYQLGYDTTSLYNCKNLVISYLNNWDQISTKEIQNQNYYYITGNNLTNNLIDLIINNENASQLKTFFTNLKNSYNNSSVTSINSLLNSINTINYDPNSRDSILFIFKSVYNHSYLYWVNKSSAIPTFNIFYDKNKNIKLQSDEPIIPDLWTVAAGISDAIGAVVGSPGVITSALVGAIFSSITVSVGEYYSEEEVCGGCPYCGKLCFSSLTDENNPPY